MKKENYVRIYPADEDGNDDGILERALLTRDEADRRNQSLALEGKATRWVKQGAGEATRWPRDPEYYE